jgi:hypothetical protein
MKASIAALAALAGLALACLCTSLPPTSDCSTPNKVALLPALAFLGLYAPAGLYAALKGRAAERLIVVLGTALILAGYFVVLSMTLPMAFGAEISCAGERAPVERMRASP